MEKAQYERIEKYMQACMKDAAHDKEHVYRVLFNALEIAEGEAGVDCDVLVAACLLHDIGRQEQFADRKLDHAEVGAAKARTFLTSCGFSAGFADKVSDCIRAHRFRSGCRPETAEAKILFDADKVDVTGAIGIARTIFYQGEVGTPLYSVDSAGRVLPGGTDEPDSFFREYKFKLKDLYGKFLTRRGAELAKQRQAAAADFYRSLLEETAPAREKGLGLLKRVIG